MLSISLITLVIEKETQPHINPFLSAFTYVLHWQVILVVLYTLLLDSEMTISMGRPGVVSASHSLGRRLGGPLAEPFWDGVDKKMGHKCDDWKRYNQCDES